jgi:MOSC domain-containing protein YiiM
VTQVLEQLSACETSPVRTLNAVEILHLYVSPGHNYFGHHGKPADGHRTIEVPRVRCLAGRGIEGDRFCDFKENYKGQITFFAWEVNEGLSRECGVSGISTSVFRRNVITRGLDLNELIGVEFEIQGVRFAGVEECRPCYWMNSAFHPEAEERLKGRGGLRARILTNGSLGKTNIQH